MAEEIKAVKRKSTAKPKHADADEYRRFVEMARETGADESPEAFERAFKKVVKAPAGAKARQK